MEVLEDITIIVRVGSRLKCTKSKQYYSKSLILFALFLLDIVLTSWQWRIKREVALVMTTGKSNARRCVTHDISPNFGFKLILVSAR